MSRLATASVLVVLLCVATNIGATSAAAGATHSAGASAPSAAPFDLGAALDANGVFHGSPGAAGSIDPDVWTLASDLAAGEPPRFVPASQAPLVGTGWSAFGSTLIGALGTNGNVSAMAVSGSDLYVAGQFTNAGGVPEADGIARWDGSKWSALGSDGAGDGPLGGYYPYASSIAISGTDVYVGGTFTNVAGVAEADAVARWDGSDWSALGSNGAGDGALIYPFGTTSVAAIVISGSDVYVGGSFLNAAGIVEADNVARWDGSDWSALGSNGAGNGALGNYDTVSALAVSGNDVYVGGYLYDVAGIPEADAVARWDGSTWSALGSNGAGNGAIQCCSVWALAVSGSDVYVGGQLYNVAGIPEADAVARWDGSTWSALGSNGAGDGALVNGYVYALAISGSQVYVGGSLNDAAGIPEADGFVRWDGSSWSALGSNGAGDGALGTGGGAFALAISGADVYVGGYFVNAAGDGLADGIAKWDGSNYSALGRIDTGQGAIGSTRVDTLAVSGNDMYVGGGFTDVAGLPAADYIAHWDGSQWLAVGSNGGGNGALNSAVLGLAVSGDDVYAVGSFTNAAGIPEADRVAHWNGTSWSALGSNGAGNGALNDVARAVSLSGGDIVVGGDFQNAAGVAEADRVARWNGSSWSALGSNGAGNGALNNVVRALAINGANTYVGGSFTNAAGTPEADYLAKWDGSSWSALGSNGSGNGALNGVVRALALAGANLYAGGSFTNAAGLATADYVALWNGSSWSSLGSNGAGNGALNKTVRTIVVSGSNAYVGGEFVNAGGIGQADYVAWWNGLAWTALETEDSSAAALSATVNALAISADGVVAGGYFKDAAGVEAADYVALWSSPPLASAQPDGRIRIGSRPLGGNDIYNTTGLDQTRQTTNPIGSSRTFKITVQNDGDGYDQVRLSAPAGAPAGYTVRYFFGATDITASVVAGTYVTANLAPDEIAAFTARVDVGAGALAGSSVIKLLTLTSVTSPSMVDALKFIVLRS